MSDLNFTLICEKKSARLLFPLSIFLFQYTVSYYLIFVAPKLISSIAVVVVLTEFDEFKWIRHH